MNNHLTCSYVLCFPAWLPEAINLLNFGLELGGAEDVRPLDLDGVNPLGLATAGCLGDSDGEGDRVRLTSDLNVLDPATVGTGDSRSLVGSVLDLSVVVWIKR